MKELTAVLTENGDRIIARSFRATENGSGAFGHYEATDRRDFVNPQNCGDWTTFGGFSRRAKCSGVAPKIRPLQVCQIP